MEANVFVLMGEVTRAAGLKGEFRVSPTGNFEDRIARSRFLRLSKTKEGPGRPVRCRGLRWKGSVAIMALEGVSDRNGAEEMRGEWLGFESADYEAEDFPKGPALAPFVYHGLRVVTREGREVGRVDDYLVYPANGVLRVVDAQDREFLIPVIEEVIDEVDREAGLVRIDAIAGLLEDEG